MLTPGCIARHNATRSAVLSGAAVRLSAIGNPDSARVVIGAEGGQRQGSHSPHHWCRMKRRCALYQCRRSDNVTRNQRPHG